MAKQEDLKKLDDSTGSAEPCLVCEALIPDAVDGVLTEADQAWFERHLTTCEACSDMVADAQRGAAWLEMLKAPRPEPGAALLGRILAETSGREALHLIPSRVPVVAVASNVISFPARMAEEAPGWSPLARLLETRLAMTAAMAFFSIALTLNLTGVRLDASDLRPAHVKNTWYQATAQVHRSYDNLRVVRVLTSRVETLREGAVQTKEADPKPTPAKPEGSSHREMPSTHTPLAMTVQKQQWNEFRQGGVA